MGGVGPTCVFWMGDFSIDRTQRCMSCLKMCMRGLPHVALPMMHLCLMGHAASWGIHVHVCFLSAASSWGNFEAAFFVEGREGDLLQHLRAELILASQPCPTP